MEDHNFFTKEEALELFKRTTTDPIKQERKYISNATETGRYKVIVHYELSGEQVQVLRNLGFIVDKSYDDDGCYICTIMWDTPKIPKDKVLGMNEESIEAFNAVKMHLRTKEVNAATLREIKKIITPLAESDDIHSNFVILDKELSNRVSMSSEVRKTIMEAGFDLDINYHGRFTIYWDKLKAEAMEQKEQEEDEDGQRKDR